MTCDDKAVLAEAFRRIVADIHRRNCDVDPDVIEAEIEAALKEARREATGTNAQVAFDE